MRFAANLSLVCLMLATLAVPAFSQTNLYSPTNGSTVSSPFTLNVNANSCSSHPVTAIGYSLDNSAQTSSWPANYINGPVGSPSGWHTLHVKVWNSYGGVCVTDVSIDVVATATTSSASTSSSGGSVVPSYAAQVSSIQALGNWTGIHDGGTPGSSSGTMSMQNSPSLTGAARLFANQFWDYGGERYSVQFGDDQTSTNFFYDAWVYIANDSNGFANLEFDLNQTMSNGITNLMGFQCDTWNNTWDYTVNAGSLGSPYDTWRHSGAYCNVHNWSPNTWHHVQIYFSHDGGGYVTYHSVWLDGAEQGINATALSGFQLGWGPALVTNFQIDGNNPGTTWGNVYLDEVSVSRW